jgi:hypothetical protein
MPYNLLTRYLPFHLSDYNLNIIQEQNLLKLLFKFYFFLLLTKYLYLLSSPTNFPLSTTLYLYSLSFREFYHNCAKLLYQPIFFTIFFLFDE